MKGDLLERGIFKYEVSLSVTLAEFLTSHHRAAHSPDAVLDVQCSGNVPLGKLHCPVINLNNQLHSIGSTVNFYEISSPVRGASQELGVSLLCFLLRFFPLYEVYELQSTRVRLKNKGGHVAKVIQHNHWSKIQYTS